MTEETSKENIQINHQTLKSALTSALDYCKLGRYDYVLTANDIPKIQKQLERALKKHSQEPQTHTDVVANCVSGFANALVQDSFTECFKSGNRVSYNNTPFLYFAYTIGVLIRYCVLLPVRAVIFFANLLFFAFLIVGILIVCPIDCYWRKRVLLFLFNLTCKGMCLSYSTVTRIHGEVPKHKSGRIFVGNHTSTMDFAVLCQITPFSVIAQRHPGFMGFVQNTVCKAVDPVYFDRKDAKDKKKVAQLLRDRTFDKTAQCPLLVFPEGVCTNNKFSVQFKKGAFDLGAEVCPIAIKYSESSNCMYQNSKKMGFLRYLISLWTQWALIADVWFMPAVCIQDGEAAEDFAHRVQLMISKQAGLTPRQWDGMLKYVQISQKMIDEQKESYARQLGLIERQIDDENFSASMTGSAQ
ncbi:Lysophosphatidic_acid acyltransferase/Glycerol-3-phosphate 1-O-acyltransferase [Hexamita inflata]|uniref:Lysophosphatidic acid acyltransferase/Glycerol-3-phosphate 1-O-acyltransferase n=1 Tax=Hexamita inflata TaxID=28002 RepID=A0AA86PXP4_9EUKA|nr:Lysophosphatidic acid acyltransferase/Glycerol-3-phosphate 1-O-acyltransferase [Hexamita inflata]CAI9967882.1 Lysophosphatidic acid acyltransferase/Glycerol-3-phosphate 1-O-acyltransferase [Hexamita inflata]